MLKGGVVSSGQLLNVTCVMERKLSADAAENFLQSLTKEHWLTEVVVLIKRSVHCTEAVHLF